MESVVYASAAATSFFSADFFDFLIPEKSINTGVAIHTEEYVPTITPIIKAKMKPLMAAPPKMKMINNTMNVVMDVLIVRDKVEFNDRLI